MVAGAVGLATPPARSALLADEALHATQATQATEATDATRATDATDATDATGATEAFGDARFELHIAARSDVDADVYAPDHRWLESCHGSCELRLRPGRYRLETSGKGVQSRSKWIDVRSDARVVIDPGDRDTNVAGLVLGISGAAVAAGSLTLLIYEYASHTDSGDDCKRWWGVEDNCSLTPAKHWDGSAGPYLLVTTAGALVSAVGWALFSGSLTRIRVSHVGDSRSALPFSLAAAPTHGGATFTLRGAF